MRHASLAVLGLLLVALAVLYSFEPARSLPVWLPGHGPSGVFHAKAAAVAFVLGLALIWPALGALDRR
jgi:hypothetical protein